MLPIQEQDQVGDASSRGAYFYRKCRMKELQNDIHGQEYVISVKQKVRK